MSSAMIESYDTQMTDYNADIDMHMHASGSEPWLHEVQMEDDQPGSKASVRLDEDVTIEIDMDEHSIEYDMVDDEHAQNIPSPQIVDVEVYDVSLAQSPAMNTVDSPLPTAAVLIPPAQQPAEHPPQHIESSLSQVFATENSRKSPSPSENDASVLRVQGMTSDHTPSTEKPKHSQPEQTRSQHENTSNTAYDEGLLLVSNSVLTSKEEEQDHSTYGDDPSNSEHHVQATERPETEMLQRPIQEVSENVESTKTPAATSSGDPHEISDGVYIDPPPPVLLSTAVEDLQFQHSFFNAPEGWQGSPDHRILLHHLPTLYYEPLSSIFEALRQDEFIQSLFQSNNAELILEALDLTLTLSEDNVFAREVSLHDLNILHDASGLSGPLRIRLFVSTPRFIVRYQQLQDHVNRLQNDPAYRESSTIQAPVSDNLGREDDLKAQTNDEVKSAEDAQTENPDETTPLLRDESDHEEGDAVDRGLVLDQDEVAAKHQDGVDESTHLDDGESADQQANPLQASQDDQHDEEQSTTADTYSEHSNNRDEDQTNVVLLEEAEHETSEEQEPVVDDEESVPNEVYDEYSEQLVDNVDLGEQEPDQSATGVIIDVPTGSNQKSAEEHLSSLDESDQNGEAHNDDHTEQGHDSNIDQVPLPSSSSSATPILPMAAEDLDEDAEGELDTNEFFEPVEDENAVEAVTETRVEGQLPELPSEPLSFDEDEAWDGEYGADATDTGVDVDATWEDDHPNADAEQELQLSASNHSSATLSSRASKRTFDEFELGDEGFDEVVLEELERIESPDPKRSRVH